MSYGELRRATESYGELWIPVAKTKLYNIDTLLVKSYGELRRATESYRLLSRAIESYGLKVCAELLSDSQELRRATESHGELRRAMWSYG